MKDENQHGNGNVALPPVNSAAIARALSHIDSGQPEMARRQIEAMLAEHPNDSMLQRALEHCLIVESARAVARLRSLDSGRWLFARSIFNEHISPSFLRETLVDARHPTIQADLILPDGTVRRYDAAGLPLCLGAFPSGLLTPSLLPVTADGQIPSFGYTPGVFLPVFGSYCPEIRFFEMNSGSHGNIILDLGTKQVVLDHPIINLSLSYLCTEYYHAAELACRAQILYKFPELAALKVVVPGNAPSFFLELLELVGISGDRLMPIDPGTTIRAPQIFVPSMASQHHFIYPSSVEFLRERAEVMLAESALSDIAAEKVFISRHSVGSRRLINEIALEDRLRERGFDIVVPAELSVRQQIARLSAAKVIVATHGSGLTNVVFAPAGALVFEIFTKFADAIPILNASCGHRSFGFYAERIVKPGKDGDLPDRPHQPDDEYEINIDAFISFIERNIENA